MNKKQILKVLRNRYLDYITIIQWEDLVFGLSPKFKSINPYLNECDRAFDKLFHKEEKLGKMREIKVGKNGEHEKLFIYELVNYTNKMFLNGVYYSENFMKSLYPTGYFRNLSIKKIYNSHQNAKIIKNHIDYRTDTLSAFIILRTRLEEMALQYYFLYKAKIFIKEKKWSELFTLIYKINYSNFQEEISIKLKKADRKYRSFLKFLLKKPKRLHVSEIIRYVSSQKEIKIFPIKDKTYLKATTSEKDYFNKHYDKLRIKNINKIYNELSLKLHPNNLFLRNIMTTPTTGVKKLLIMADHFKSLRENSDFLSHHYLILYSETLDILKYFVDMYCGDEPGEEILRGFRQSVENKIIKNSSLAFKIAFRTKFSPNKTI